MPNQVGSIVRTEPQFGDHSCWAYRTDEELSEVLTWYVSGGLAEEQRVACFVPSSKLDRVRTRLSESIAVDESEQRGALILGTFEEAYMPDGTFDQDRQIAGYARMVEEAISVGYKGLRVMGEATGILSNPKAREQWPGYELRADLLNARSPLIALCAYDSQETDMDGIRMVGSLHPDLIGSWDSMPLFHIHASRAGGIKISGEVDFGNFEELRAALVDAAVDVDTSVLHLDDLEFIDVAGMRALSAAIRAITQEGHNIEVRGAKPAFKRLWGLLELGNTTADEVS